MILRDQKYLDWIKQHDRCLVTGRKSDEHETVDPAHIGTAGKGLKRSDNEVLPLIHSIHSECHNKGEVSVLRRLLPDKVLREALRAYARQLYQEYKAKHD